jgi:hypothetical protein
MKIRQLHLNSIRGNSLVLTIVVCGLIGFLLAAYMGLVKSQNIATMRSQSWNATIPVIEAGIEDGLQHVNTRLTNDLTGEGWQRQGNIYVTKRWIASNYYTVTISNWVVGSPTNHPIIESRGYVVAPVMVASIGGPVFAAVAPPPSRPIVARGIRVLTTTSALFSKGLVAKGQIDLRGNNVLSDSFDSRFTTTSTGGRYDVAKRRANGSVATNAGLTNSLNVGNAEIYGRVSTGPGGSMSIGPQGAVGDIAFVSNQQNHNKIQQGYFTDDMNVDFASVTMPPALLGGFTPNNGTYQGNSYTYVIGRDPYYRISSLGMSGNQTLVVTGACSLYVQTTVAISGNASILIAPGGSLTMYVGGPSANLGGNGIVNQNASALAFTYYGLTNNTSVDIGGNGTFVGTLYAPNAALTLHGGGGGDEDFSGAAIAKTVDINGHFKFHYDEALAFIGPPKGYVVTKWDEMSPAEVAGGPSF